MQKAARVNLDPDNMMKGMLVFEFNPEENKLTGHAGCNNINARIEVIGDKVTFGRIISTRMSCPDMSAERSIVSMIENKTFNYKINEGILTLENESGKMMVLRKVD
jgi:heat shock protein HslJ